MSNTINQVVRFKGLFDSKELITGLNQFQSVLNGLKNKAEFFGRYFKYHK